MTIKWGFHYYSCAYYPVFLYCNGVNSYPGGMALHKTAQIKMLKNSFEKWSCRVQLVLLQAHRAKTPVFSYAPDSDRIWVRRFFFLSP